MDLGQRRGAEAREDVRDAMSALGRSLRRVSLHRHARESHASYLLPALRPLCDLLDRRGSLSFELSPTALSYKGEPVYSEPAREGSLCFRLHRDGVRSITFLSGLDLEELVAFAGAALPEGSGGEDCVTRLWKAELRFVRIGAVSGYRLDGEPTGDAVADAASRAKASLERFGAAISAEDESAARALAPVFDAAERASFDPDSWSDLARRAAGTLLRVVHRGAAGRDMPALAATFAKLLDEMLARSETALLASTLAALAALGEDLRKPLAAALADSGRLSRALDLAGSRPGTLDAAIETWLSLLPVLEGELALDLLHKRGGDRNASLLANAAAARFARCLPHIERLLRSGPDSAARALLAALASVPEGARADFAAAALEHRTAAVRVAAVSLVASSSATSIARLSLLLDDEDIAVRIAAVNALGGCTANDEVAELLIAALEKPASRRADREELIAAHRALGKLGSDLGFQWLVGRLLGGRRKLFKKIGEGDQLLAVQGLVAEGGGRAADVLEHVAAGSEHLRVGAASRAGARMLRSQRPPESPDGRVAAA
jgi:hypothetical protein